MPRRGRHLERVPCPQLPAIAGAALALALQLAGCSATQDYEILLCRAAKPGQKFHVSSTGSTSQKRVVTAGGQVTQQKSVAYSVHLDAEAAVLDVSPAGQPARVSYTIARCVRADGENEEVLVKPGLVLVASVAGEDRVFEVNGTRLAPEAEEALELVVRLSATDDVKPEAFSPKGRKRVGESWKVNAEALAGPVPGTGLSVTKEGIDGTMTLVGVVKVGGRDCLDLRGEFSVRVGPAPVSATLRLEKMETNVALAAKLPLDPSLPTLETSMDLTMTTRWRDQPDPAKPESITEATTKRRFETKRTPTE
ncbi:MAG: hypothetical protein FJ291_32430 [Planctomycetes bacterium]|nr:hypothetical protein [Planctomycetota bacterium]